MPRKEETMVDGAGVRITGPLAPYAPGVWRELRGRGYTALSSRNVLRLMAHLSRWLQSEGLEPVELSAERIRAFCAARCGAGYTGFLTPRALRPILDYLRGGGGVSLPEAAPRVPTPLDGILDPYAAYLRRERSLTDAAIARYASAVRQLLARRFAHEPIALAAPTASDLTAAGPRGTQRDT